MSPLRAYVEFARAGVEVEKELRRELLPLWAEDDELTLDDLGAECVAARVVLDVECAWALEKLGELDEVLRDTRCKDIGVLLLNALQEAEAHEERLEGVGDDVRAALTEELRGGLLHLREEGRADGALVLRPHGDVDRLEDHAEGLGEVDLQARGERARSSQGSER